MKLFRCRKVSKKRSIDRVSSFGEGAFGSTTALAANLTSSWSCCESLGPLNYSFFDRMVLATTFCLQGCDSSPRKQSRLRPPSLEVFERRPPCLEVRNPPSLKLGLASSKFAVFSYPCCTRCRSCPDLDMIKRVLGSVRASLSLILASLFQPNMLSNSRCPRKATQSLRFTQQMEIRWAL